MEPVSQLAESLGDEKPDLLVNGRFVARRGVRLSPAWLHRQMVNALEEKEAYRGTQEVVAVMKASEGNSSALNSWLVISDGQHSATCLLSRDARQSLSDPLPQIIGHFATLDCIRVTKVDGKFVYYCRSLSIGPVCDILHEAPDVDADGSITARESSTGTDVSELVYEADEAEAAPELDEAGLLDFRRRRCPIDENELSLIEETQVEEAQPNQQCLPLSPGLDVDMRATASKLQPRRGNIQHDSALLVRLWANDVAAVCLSPHNNASRSFVLQKELPCTGWCGLSLTADR